MKNETETEIEIVTLMKILSNVHRLKILRIIYKAKVDLCVNQIAEKAKISQSLASHQLAYLSAHGVVEGHRIGQTMCYVPAKNKLATKLFKLLNVLVP